MVQHQHGLSAEPRSRGLADAQGERGCDRRVEGVATRVEHLDARFRGTVVLAGDNATTRHGDSLRPPNVAIAKLEKIRVHALGFQVFQRVPPASFTTGFQSPGSAPSLLAGILTSRGEPARTRCFLTARRRTFYSPAAAIRLSSRNGLGSEDRS